MAQNRVRRQTEPAVAGMLHDRYDSKITTRVNKDPAAKQIESVTVDTAANDTEYTITINGVDITFTSDSDATKQEVRDGLIAAVEDEPLVSGDVIPEEGSGSDVLTLTSVFPGESFDFSESDSNLSSSQTQAAAEANEIEFARAIMDDGLAVRGELDENSAGTYGDGAQTGKLLEAANLTAQEVEVTVPYVASAIYSFSVTVAGETHEVAVAADTDQDTTVANIVTALNDQLPANTVVASDDGGGSSSEVILTAELAGLPFEVGFGTSDEGSSNPDLTLSSDNRSTLTDAGKALLGISAYSTEFEYARDGASGSSTIDPNSPFAVMENGRIWCDPEDSVAEGDEVYVRLENAGSFTENGRFRASADTGCVKVPGARWVGVSGELAVLELDK